MSWRDASTYRAPTCIEPVGMRRDASTRRVPTAFGFESVVAIYVLTASSFFSSEFQESIFVR